MAPDWIIKAFMIQAYPDLYKFTKEYDYVIHDSGTLHIDD